MSLRFPLVFWNENEPPVLSYTACLVTSDGKSVVTGTSSGICVLWKFNTDTDDEDEVMNVGTLNETQNPESGHHHHHDHHGDEPSEKDSLGSKSRVEKLEPFAVLYGHESAVTAMCECFLDNTPAVCSVSIDGTLCVWSLSDGRCVALMPHLLQGEPTSVVSLTCPHDTRPESQSIDSAANGRDHLAVDDSDRDDDGDENDNGNGADGSRRNASSRGTMEEELSILLSEKEGRPKCANLVACAGRDNMIEIVDLRQMRVIHVLEGHTEWVRDLSCRRLAPIQSAQQGDLDTVVLVSVGDDSTIRYWKMDSMSVSSVESSIGQSDTGGIAIPSSKPIKGKKDTKMMMKKKKEKKDKHDKKKKNKSPKHAMEEEAPSASSPSAVGTLTTTLTEATAEAGVHLSFPNDEVRSPMDDMHCIAVNAYTDRPLSVSQSFDCNLILVVSENKWMIFEDHAFQPSIIMHAPESSKKLHSGHFIDNQHVLISLTSGDAYVYRIPELPDPAPLNPRSRTLTLDIAEESTSASSYTSVGNALMDAMFSHITSKSPASSSPSSLPASAPSSGDSSPVIPAASHMQPRLIKVLRPSSGKVESAQSRTTSFLSRAVWHSEGNYIVRADTNGRIALWKMGQQDDTLLAVEGQVSIKDMGTVTLANGWWTKSDSPDSKIVTATHLSVPLREYHVPLLVHGYIDGTISIYPTVPSTLNNLSRPGPIVFQAHEARVTSLLVMYDEDRDRQILISGSGDFTVKVWDLDLTMASVNDSVSSSSSEEAVDRRLITTFYNHSGTVNLIFLPPRSIRKKLQNCFCSVAEDRSVIMYSAKTMECLHTFGGHPSAVVSVYFRQDLDYLLVRCSDATVYVWQLSTGLMERKISGRRAMELIERSEGHGSVRRSDAKISFSKQSAIAHERSRGFLESIALGVDSQWDYSSSHSNREYRHHLESPDLQVLIVSVRRLIVFINSRLDTLKAYYAGKRNAGDGQTRPLPYTLVCALSYALQYGNEEQCPSMGSLRRKLQISSEWTQQMPRAYLGLKGRGSTFSLIVPKASKLSHPCSFSPVLTALHSISVVSILICLSAIPALQGDCQSTIRYYLYDLPNEIPQYKDPSFLWCAQYLKDLSKEIQSAARQVMAAALFRLQPQEQNELAEKYVSIMLSCAGEELKQNVVIALAILTLLAPTAVDERIVSIAAFGLLDIVEKGGIQQNTAIALLGEGYRTWRQFIPDETGFCRALFHLSLPALTASISTSTGSESNSGGGGGAGFEMDRSYYDDIDDDDESKDDLQKTGATTTTNLALNTLQAFVNMINVAPFVYIELINQMSSSTHQSSPSMLAAIVTSLYPAMRKYPACLVPFIAPVGALLLKVLDPQTPAIRDACIQPATFVLRYMVEIYPMVSFHQEKQRLSIGSPDGKVVIYDMQTASKWQLFEAHSKSPIAAVSFSPSGDLFATFSPKDGKCKVWSFDSSGVFTLLGMLNRSLKTFNVPTSRASITDEEIIRAVRITWEGAKQFSLTPDKNTRKIVFSF